MKLYYLTSELLTLPILLLFLIPGTAKKVDSQILDFAMNYCEKYFNCPKFS